MNCPSCKTKLKKAIFYNVEVDYCDTCLSMFFEQDELRMAKDERDKNLNWLDIDLWRDKKKLKIAQGDILCPVCQVPLYAVNYGDSEVEVDVCSLCKGIWLNRGEFKKILEYLKDRAQYEILENYFKNLIEEIAEIFVGPETLKEEILDILTILKLLNYKFAVQLPRITKIISSLPK